jgi:hypothetical protein
MTLSLDKKIYQKIVTAKSTTFLHKTPSMEHTELEHRLKNNPRCINLNANHMKQQDYRSPSNLNYTSKDLNNKECKEILNTEL